MDIGQPLSLIATIGSLLARGMVLEKILPAFTSNVARLLRLHDRGRVAEGMVADLLVLDEKNQVRDVMAAGRWHVRDYRQLVRGQYELPVDEDAGLR